MEQKPLYDSLDFKIDMTAGANRDRVATILNA
jgi:hypothetical protein